MTIDLRSLEKYAEEHGVPIMEKTGIKFLKDYIKKNKIKSILEIGTAIGYSALSMASVSEDITVTSIERDPERYLEAVRNINKFNMSKRITLILNDALTTNIEGKFDLIFIDAAKAQNINFFNHYLPNLSDNGTIITDNMNFHGLVENKEEIKSKNLRAMVTKIENYIIFLDEHPDFDTNFYDIGDGIAVTTRKECKND